MNKFDPFNDRKSRDIRNRISEAFVAALEERDPGVMRREVDTLMPIAVEGVYRHYIEDRTDRYRQVLADVGARAIDDMGHRAIAIWNAGLFFECHEYLEGAWLGSAGPERKALQGFIQAAGVFVHRQLGRERAADRLSSKAVRLLEEYGSQLSFIANIEDLIAALKQKGEDAPELKGK